MDTFKASTKPAYTKIYDYYGENNKNIQDTTPILWTGSQVAGIIATFHYLDSSKYETVLAKPGSGADADDRIMLDWKDEDNYGSYTVDRKINPTNFYKYLGKRAYIGEYWTYWTHIPLYFSAYWWHGWELRSVPGALTGLKSTLYTLENICSFSANFDVLGVPFFVSQVGYMTFTLADDYKKYLAPAVFTPSPLPEKFTPTTLPAKFTPSQPIKKVYNGGSKKMKDYTGDFYPVQKTTVGDPFTVDYDLAADYTKGGDL